MDLFQNFYNNKTLMSNVRSKFLNLTTTKKILNKTTRNWFYQRVGFLIKGKFTLRKKNEHFYFAGKGYNKNKIFQ